MVEVSAMFLRYSFSVDLQSQLFAAKSLLKFVHAILSQRVISLENLVLLLNDVIPIVTSDAEVR